MSNAYLIFSDLDGTLLDHDTYDWSPAASTIEWLNQADIPLIIVTSKTASEVIPLRQQLKNKHPFVVENGAAVFIPKDYFKTVPKGCVVRENFWIYSSSPPRAHWKTLLQHLGKNPHYQFKSFSQMSDQELAKCTGLSLEAAKLAALREFSEPILWLSEESDKQAFIQECQNQGAQILEGGRFLHLTENADKGKATQWLTQLYAQKMFKQDDATLTTIALGDSQNDAAMLAAVDHPVVIASKKSLQFDVPTSKTIVYTKNRGPQGWVEAIHSLLENATV